MGKNPAYLMYPSDWQRDLDDHPLEIEGAWIRICNRLFWTGGTATKTIEEWSRILRKKTRETEKIFEYFSSKNICDLLNQNGSITLTSRRMVRDEHIRNVRRNAGKQGGNPALKQPKIDEVLLIQNEEQKPTPSVSVSVSGSVTEKRKIKNKKNISIPPNIEDVRTYCLERKNGINEEAFMAHYNSNGWKVGLNPMKDWKAAIITWEHKQKQEGANGKNNVGFRNSGGSNRGTVTNKYDGIGEELP